MKLLAELELSAPLDETLLKYNDLCIDNEENKNKV